MPCVAAAAAAAAAAVAAAALAWLAAAIRWQVQANGSGKGNECLANSTMYLKIILMMYRTQQKGFVICIAMQRRITQPNKNLFGGPCTVNCISFRFVSDHERPRFCYHHHDVSS